jgi:HK97 family phage prohead protease
LALKDINTTPTEGMRSEAKKGLEWRKEFGRGGTAIGVARARDIINGNLSISSIKRMFSFHSRHQVDKKAEGYRPGEKGYPSAGRIAIALWGGDPGFSWSKKKVAQIKKEEEKNSYDMKNKETRIYNGNYEVRLDKDSKETKVSGYAALFDTDSRDLGFRETISKRAFDGRLEDNVILTYNHDPNLMLDRNIGGTLQLTVDERGLRYDATLPDTTAGKDVAELMKRGLLYESSFAFTVEDDEWSKDGDTTRRQINKIGRLVDVSIVGVGAYANTDVALRSKEDFEKKDSEEVVEVKQEVKESFDDSKLNLLSNELKLKKRI